MIHDPLTKLQCSPTSDGAAARSSPRSASSTSTDSGTPRSRSPARRWSRTFFDLRRRRRLHQDRRLRHDKLAAQGAYEEAQINPEEVDVCELHDCFSANELITYEALGLPRRARAQAG